MIRPIDAYPGKVATPTTEYPDGKAQNITAPGDGTGTPWEAKLVNDLFGFQQFITAKAGITPNGTPDNATASQQFDALWKLLNARPLTFNLTADANYTLTADQNLYGNLTITDTGVVLTTGRDIIVDTVGRLFLFTNSTAQTLTVKTSGGTGIAVVAGASVALVCDETNVLDFADFVSAPADIRLNTADELYAGQTAGVDILKQNGDRILSQPTAWVKYDLNGSIETSHNVASVIRTSTGRYTITWDFTMDNDNYAILVTNGTSGDFNSTFVTPTTTNLTVACDLAQSASAPRDAAMSVVIYGGKS